MVAGGGLILLDYGNNLQRTKDTVLALGVQLRIMGSEKIFRD